VSLRVSGAEGRRLLRWVARCPVGSLSASYPGETQARRHCIGGVVRRGLGGGSRRRDGGPLHRWRCSERR
jgi:hypothetical protein